MRVTLLTCLLGDWGAAAEPGGWGVSLNPKPRSLPSDPYLPPPSKKKREDQCGLLPAPPHNSGHPNLFPGKRTPWSILALLASPSQGTRSPAGPVEAINNAEGPGDGGGRRSNVGWGLDTEFDGGLGTPRGRSQAVPLGSRPGLRSLRVGRGDAGGSSSPGDGSVSASEGSPEPRRPFSGL